MKYIFFIFSILFSINLLNAQSLKGSQLLERSIKYHDPDDRWNKFKSTLFIDQLDIDHNPQGTRTVTIDLPNKYFKLIQTRGNETITREVIGENCQNSINGIDNFSKELKEKHQLTCERSTMYRDYFSYLYGLPMKLRDPGTLVHQELQEVSYDDKEVYSLRVTYEKEVGEDTWYFFFDKTTFAMIGYQFFHDESKNDGEHITLSGEITVCGIRIPKDRYWYSNSDNKFLGADLLKKK